MNGNRYKKEKSRRSITKNVRFIGIALTVRPLYVPLYCIDNRPEPYAQNLWSLLYTVPDFRFSLLIHFSRRNIPNYYYQTEI